MSQTLEARPWDPVHRQPVMDQKPQEKKPKDGGGEAKPQPTQAPIALSIDISKVAEIAATLAELRDGQAALLTTIDAMAKATAEHAKAMHDAMKRLDRVMSAPRSVTLNRGDDGFAKSAMSEVLVSKPKAD